MLCLTFIAVTYCHFGHRQVLELKEAIKTKDSEAEAYISEIETIGQAYEDMQTQNQHLLQQVTERDDYNIKLVSESVKAKQAQSCLLSEKQAIAKQLRQVNESLDIFKMKVTHSEEQMKASLGQAGKASIEYRHLAINLESEKLELIDAEKELKWLRTAVDSSEKEYEQNQRKMVDLQAELESERIEKKKLEEELAEWNSRVSEMNSENREATIQKLQDEIKECKAILKCGVCFDRPKEISAYGMHAQILYMRLMLIWDAPECLQLSHLDAGLSMRNLEIRHRKCPGCGTPFGQNDVREICGGEWANLTCTALILRVLPVNLLSSYFVKECNERLCYLNSSVAIQFYLAFPLSFQAIAMGISVTVCTSAGKPIGSESRFPMLKGFLNPEQCKLDAQSHAARTTLICPVVYPEWLANIVQIQRKTEKDKSGAFEMREAVTSPLWRKSGVFDPIMQR
ncbi:hypothetical protein ACLOJK_006507 [Asimina triloba]